MTEGGSGTAQFCTQCGRRHGETDRFCAGCGAAKGAAVIGAGHPATDKPPTQSSAMPAEPMTGFTPSVLRPVQPPRAAPAFVSLPPSAAPMIALPTGSWRETVIATEVLHHDEVRQLVSGASGLHGHGMTAEEFFKVAKPMMKAVSPGSELVPMEAIAELSVGLGTRLGIKSGTEMRTVFAHPPGRVIAAVLCSFASRGQNLSACEQGRDGCALSAKLPSSLFTWTGDILATLVRQPEGTVMVANITIPGQMYDWGKGKKVLEDLISDVPKFISLQG
jgi:hypothetical protein